VLAVALSACAFGTLASADSFTPVRLAITINAIARLHIPLKVTVRVSADPGVLDNRTGPLRIRVKLASECGGTYQYTTGPTLLDERLSPQPSTGRAYVAVATGSGRPVGYGVQTVCTWLEEEGDQREFANDQSIQVDVSKACTRAAARYDAARRRHRRAGGAGARRDRKRIAADRKAARRACGPGVPL
jgi:hypothetical protein